MGKGVRGVHGLSLGLGIGLVRCWFLAMWSLLLGGYLTRHRNVSDWTKTIRTGYLDRAGLLDMVGQQAMQSSNDWLSHLKSQRE